MWKYSSVEVRNCASCARKCGFAKVWQCGSMAVLKCRIVEVWKCGSVAAWTYDSVDVW